MHVRTRVAFLALLILFAIPSSGATPLDNIGFLEIGRMASTAHNMTKLPSAREGTQRFACVQPPNACSSNSDCTCSGCCAQLGEGGPQVCQPTC
jgi:hypothetical protein